MTQTRYQIQTKLDGFIRMDEDGGKFNNRGFSFLIPSKLLPELDKAHDELCEHQKSKLKGKRVEVGNPKWEEDGLVSYSYGEGDGTRKVIFPPVVIDTEGELVSKPTLKSIRGGTEANVMFEITGYNYGNKVGTKFRVLGVQITKLVTFGGATDAGSLSVEEVAGMFGTTDGFKQADPQVSDEREATGTPASYDF